MPPSTAKICYIIGALEVGGAEKQLFELVKNIDEKFFEPVVISLNSGDLWAERIREIGVKLIELDRKKSFEMKRLCNLVKILKEIRPAIVHSFLFSANSYGRIASILAGAPVLIASERSLPDKDGNKLQVLINKTLGWFSHAIVCNSQSASDVLIRKYRFNPKKIFTIHNGMDGSLVCRPKTLSKKNKLIGTVGRLTPEKNHMLFLDAARILLNTHKNLRFIIVGGGPLRGELEKYSKLIGIDDKVEFTGDRRDVDNLLREMDVFILTSAYEGLSNAIMEAMLSGLPVIATDVGGNGELVENGITGFLSPAGDAEALARKAEFLVEDEKMSRIMGENGRKVMLTEFSIFKMVSITQDLYFKLLRSENIYFKGA